MSVRQENRFRAQSLANFRRVGIFAGQIESLCREQRRLDQRTPIPIAASRQQVCNWMRLNAEHYETATALAEAANVALALPCDAMDDPGHWIWDEAFNALEVIQ